MTLWILAGLGGAIGAAARYGLYQWAAAQPGGFPLGAFAANVIGCALAGACAPYFAKAGASEGWRAFAVVGVFGGLTTFSAFVMDASRLVAEGRAGAAALYGGASLALGFAVFLLAAFAARPLWSAA